MPVPKSAPVAENVMAKSSDYNKLRVDLLTHTHDGYTTKVDHHDLENGGVNVDANYSHDEIDDHIDATYGVHGGTSSQYVCLGKKPDEAAKNLVVVTGTLQVSIAGQPFGSRRYNEAWIEDYGVTFASEPQVLVQPKYTGDRFPIVETQTEVYVDKCKIRFCNYETSSDNTVEFQFDWMAIGWL